MACPRLRVLGEMDGWEAIGKFFFVFFLFVCFLLAFKIILIYTGPCAKANLLRQDTSTFSLSGNTVKYSKELIASTEVLTHSC
jgi:hypothetical protein